MAASTSSPLAEGVTTFKVLQWNLLAEGLDQPSDFPQSPPESLLFSTRFDKIMDVIRQLEPEILCLQELNHQEQLAMHLSGHALIHCSKLDSPCLPNHPPDGCGLLVRRDRFDILEVTTHYYTAVAPGPETPLANQCAILAKLRCRATGRVALVATTHLKAKAGESEKAARLSQTRQLLSLVAAKAVHMGSRIPAILCGDFNSDHKKEAVVYDEIYAHSLRLSSCYNAHTQREETGTAVHFDSPALEAPVAPPAPPADAALSTDAAATTTTTTTATSSDSTESTPRAHHDAPGPNSLAPRAPVSEYKLGEPAYTTWKFRGSKPSSEKKECIDYIWATLGPMPQDRTAEAAEASCADGESWDGWARALTAALGAGGAKDAGQRAGTVGAARLALRSVVPLRGAETTGPRGLPSEAFPSDHLFLCSEFALL